MIKLLDVVFDPNLPGPEGNGQHNIVGEEGITLMDVMIYVLIFMVCLGLLFLVVRKIKMINNENI